jgi:tRNA(fMet)-specific endonuclease VapC
MACWDTTVILDLVGRSGRRRQRDAEAKLRQLEHDQPHTITRFTLAELLIGIQLSDQPQLERARIDPFVSRLEVLEFDSRSMRIYPNVFLHLRALGMVPGVIDMLIASVALSHGQRLVTRNAQHFRHVPHLRVESY